MKKQSIALFLSLIFNTAYAGESLFYWDNNSGLKKADHCTLTTTNSPSFFFTKASLVALKNSEGAETMNIIPGSLVKKKDQAQTISKINIEVTGVNQATEENLDRFAQRSDKGVIDSKDLLSIETRVIELTEDRFGLKKGTFLKVYGKGEYLRVSCPELNSSRDYLAFHTFNRASDKTLGIVGVYWDETNIFKGIKTHENKIISEKINAIANEENIALDLISNASGKKVTPVVVGSKPKEKEEELQDIPSTETNKDGVRVQLGVENVVCMASANSSTNIRNDELTKVIFTVKTGTNVKYFQGWEDTRKTTIIDGKTYAFVKVEFPENESMDKKVGWLAENSISPKSECLTYKVKESEIPKAIDTKITGLDDPNCCEFPVARKVTAPFTEGQQRFGANRNGGERVHAATDLYRMRDEPVVAVAPGVIIRSHFFFYLETYAIEVRHSGGFIVRYGEINETNAANTKQNQTVRMGQVVGYVDRVETQTLMEPMLHFELYSGAATGPLNSSAKINGLNYQRRSDLLNPTRYMLKWQDAKFKK